MILLGLDTAGTNCAAAVYDSARGELLGRASADIGRGHAEQLMGFIENALAESGKTLEAVERIAVTIGPGSFTGIRVGVATARGLGLALGIPAVGVSTLHVLAAHGLAAQGQPGDTAVLAAMDAKRDELYCQLFDASGASMGEPVAIGLEDAKARFSDFEGRIVGSGAALLRPGTVGMNDFDIATVARLGALADANIDKPKPLYLRGPDAKPQVGFAIAHQ